MINSKSVLAALLTFDELLIIIGNLDGQLTANYSGHSSSPTDIRRFFRYGAPCKGLLLLGGGPRTRTGKIHPAVVEEGPEVFELFYLQRQIYKSISNVHPRILDEQS